VTVTTVVALDLDTTLLYSSRTLRLPEDGRLAPRLVVTEVWQGAPLTFCTRETERLLDDLDRLALVVPVTTRTVAQHARVRLLDGPPPTSGAAGGHRYAVVANGGHLLVDGVVDRAWASRVRRALQSTRPLADVAAALDRATGTARVSDLRIADELFVYVAVDPDVLPAETLAELTDWCDSGDWRVSLQGRRLYCVPRPLTKSAAVTELMRRTGATRLLAAGDSLLDAEVLEQADVAARPAHGELHDLAWRRPNVTVTRASGVLAGEEIVRFLLAQAAAPSPASTRVRPTTPMSR
jgi:hypothetical protein